MSDFKDVRINALIGMLQQQRDHALNQAAMLAGDLAVARAELEALRATATDPGPKEAS